MTYYLVNGRWLGRKPPDAVEVEARFERFWAETELRSRREAAAERIARRRFRFRFPWEAPA